MRTSTRPECDVQYSLRATPRGQICSCLERDQRRRMAFSPGRARTKSRPPSCASGCGRECRSPWSPASSAMPIRIEVRPIGTSTSATLRSGLTNQWWIEVSTKASAGKSGAAAGHQQRPHPPQLAEPLARDLGARRVMPADPPHQPHGEADRAEADQHARRSQHQPGGGPRSGFFCSVSSGKSNAGMQRQRRQQDQYPARDPRPVAVMPVRAERGAGSRDREIGAGDDAERAVERHGQHAAQGGQRSPHLRMLHEISEVFVGREAEARRRAVDHGVHRVGERAAAAPRPRR